MILLHLVRLKRGFGVSLTHFETTTQYFMILLTTKCVYVYLASTDTTLHLDTLVD